MNEHISTEDFCYKEASISLYATLYQNQDVTPRAALLYFHGGGLLCGNRHDLPDYHIETLCDAGYAILAFDYRLAPATKLPEIMDDVLDAIRWYLAERESIFAEALPYFLWGRSSGAYLALLAGRAICLDHVLQNSDDAGADSVHISDDAGVDSGHISTCDAEAPSAILSYYGYSFMENHWYNTPNPYYLAIPRINPMSLEPLRADICADVMLEQRFALYLCARQQGNWIAEIFDDKEKYFYAPYSFRLVDSFQGFAPVFITHASGDPDVPFAEAQALVAKLPDTTVYYVSKKQHDYDRDTDDPATITLLENTLTFLNSKAL